MLKLQKKNYVSSIIDHFSEGYLATFTTQLGGGCSIMWMTTQEPPFVMTLTGSQSTPVLVIETTHYQYRRSCGQLPCVFKKQGFQTTVKAG